MKARLFLVALACAAVVSTLPGRAALADDGFDIARDFHIASETYYQVDVDRPELDVRLEATVQAAGRGDLETIYLWAMPGATGINVSRDGVPLEFEQAAAEGDMPSIVEVTLDQPLRGRLVADIVMTYTVGAHESEISTIRPGVVETMFVSQGPGSFVLIDLPIEGDNAVDPGCVMAADQPAAVTSAGYERWVCGEVVTAAVFTTDASVQERCARMDDRCRQRTHPLPLAASAQSVTDASLITHLRGTVELSERSVPLTLRYFSFDREWAERQFEVAQRALPLLEEVFGFPYPHEEVVLRQSNFVLFAGFGGIAFTEQGEMLIAAMDHGAEHITIHELAHQWAGPVYLEGPWLWEGLAEYATHRVGEQLGVEELHLEWESKPYDDPLATWFSGSEVTDREYWYGKSGAFWEVYADAVGGHEAMTSVLGRMNEDLAALPFDGRWFMDAGEEVSGTNLDELFLDWVWRPVTAQPILAERRAAHNLVDELRAEAAAHGFTGVPLDIVNSLREWSFGAIENQVDRARDLLADHVALVHQIEAAGLKPPGTIIEAWPMTTTAGIAGLIAEQRQAVNALVETGERLAGADPDSPAHGLYRDARIAYNAGDVAEAHRLANAAAETAYTATASERMLMIAAAEQERFSDSFFERIGLIGHAPDERLDQARQAFRAGEHAEALRLARSAFDSWNGAQSRGLQRLAALAAIMSGLAFGAWWLLTRLDRAPEEVQKAQEGHYLEHDPNKPRRRSWRDYENTP